MNVLITGGNGYIAKSLIDKLKHLSTYNITSITREDFDLTNKSHTDKWFNKKYFDVIIHTAAKGVNRLVETNDNICYQNIQMFYNLLNNKHCFNKLIHFGSGAELGMPYEPYGLSKNVISKIIDTEPNFYNIRIFGIFDKNELDTRFIKSNIKRYLNKQPLEVYQDKLMDFFYMEDLVELVKYYIKPNKESFSHIHLPKNVDCIYDACVKDSLLDIAYLINSLSNYKVKINVGEGKGKNYVGSNNPFDIKWIGLEQGIKETYKQIKNGII